VLPRLTLSKLVSAWIWITLVASVVAAVDGGWLVEWTALAPSRIWRGELWRLVTWVFVERSAVALVVGCACIYKFGGELATRWGDRRLQRFMLEIIAGAAAATALLALLSHGAWSLYRVGTWAVDDALVIAWARQYPDAIIALYGLVKLNGPRLIAATIGITIVFAVFHGPLAMAPELFACAAAYYYPAARLARRA
jgi:membrane associated rhomboid family serine protease